MSAALDWIGRGRTSHAEASFRAGGIAMWGLWHLGGRTIVEAENGKIRKRREIERIPGDGQGATIVHLSNFPV